MGMALAQEQFVDGEFFRYFPGELAWT